MIGNWSIALKTKFKKTLQQDFVYVTKNEIEKDSKEGNSCKICIDIKLYNQQANMTHTNVTH